MIPVRVAFILPSSGRPVTGGERNLDALLQAFDRRKLVPVAIVRAGEIRGHLEERGIEVVELARLLPAGAAGWARYAALVARVGAEVASLLAGGHPDLRRLARLVDAIDALCADVPAGKPVPPLLRGPNGRRAALDRFLLPLHAVRVRRALARARADRCLADLSWDAAATGLATVERPASLFWYLQSSRPPGIGDGLARALAHRIIACGQGVGEVRIGRRAPYLTIANGIDATRFVPRAPGAPRPPALAHLPEDAVIVGSAGVLMADKGIDLLVRAVVPLLRRRPELHVVLAGRGPARYERELDDLIRRSGLGQRIHRLGWVTDLSALLPHLTVFALPSRFEGLPLALCEAMACEVACVATDIPGCRELADGGGIRLIPAGDVAALTGALAELLDDTGARAQIGARGRTRVLERYTFARALGDMQRVLLEA